MIKVRTREKFPRGIGGKIIVRQALVLQFAFARDPAFMRPVDCSSFFDPKRSLKFDRPALASARKKRENLRDLQIALLSRTFSRFSFRLGGSRASLPPAFRTN
jgi:hypothetical protein